VELRMLMQTLRAAQGDSVDESELASGPTPSDFEIDNGSLFGVPDKMDPDPYGVLALEKEGFQMREAGTNNRASHESFIFNPSPSSPLFSSFNRNSIDGKSMSRRSSWRTSTMSNTALTDRSMQTIDMATQTDFDTPATSPGSLANSVRNFTMTEIPEGKSEGISKRLSIDTRTKSSQETPQQPRPETPKPSNTELTHGSPEEVITPVNASTVMNGIHHDLKDPESDDEEDEAVVVHTVQQATTPQFISRARLVSVKKQPPPMLPPRNPIRDRKKPLIITGNNPHNEDTRDHATSPMSRDGSIASTHRSGVERSLSSHSMSSVELNDEKKKDELVKVAMEEDRIENTELHITTNTLPLRSPSPEKSMPGQFT